VKGQSVSAIQHLPDRATSSQGPPASEEVDTRPVTVVEGSSGWRIVAWAGIWRYRELLYFFVWRDVKVRYKQTLLGAAWALLQPVCTMVVFAFFLGDMGGMAAKIPDYPLFVFTGILPWTFFANSISSAGNSLVANQNLVTKVFFPRLIIPLGTIGASLFDFAVSFLVLGVLMAWYRVAPGWSLLFLPAVSLLLVMSTVAVGSLLAALIVSYRDFRYILQFAVQLWMFATPTIYLRLEDIGPRARLILPLNPAYGVIHAFRQTVLGGAFDWYSLAVSSGVTIVVLVGSLAYFWRVERSFADII
jgi:lipopolysaccharide transport system permease protein